LVMAKFIKGFFGKVFRLMMLISLMVGAIILLIATIRQTNSIEEAVVRENKALAEVAAKSIETGYLNFLWPFETLKKISDSEEVLFLWIVKPNGEILFADNPEMQGKLIDDSFIGTKEIIVSDSSYLGQKIKLIVCPLEIEVGKTPWSLYLGASLKPVEIAQKETIFTGLGIFILIVLFTALLAFYLSKGVTEPLEQLRKGAEIIGRGNFEHRIKIRTGDEIEELGETFNLMAEDLKQSLKDLEESKNVLEVKVKARTKELSELALTLEDKIKERTKQFQERVEELERFHRITIGREEKMMELKKKIGELEQKLKDCYQIKKSKNKE